LIVVSFTLRRTYLEKGGRRFYWPNSDVEASKLLGMRVSCIHCRTKLALIVDFMNLT